MFTLTATATEMSKMALFVFSADDSKKSVIAGGKYLSAFKRSYLALSENVMNY